jgi:glycosyltransferase involved in cell wall biosynthesis
MAPAASPPNDNEPSAITVTAIVPTYNRAPFVAQAIESLLAQTRPVDEIIVVDDASTDETAAIVRGYSAHLQYERNAENAGKPASLNRTIPNAKGSHIWIFDDDDVALPDALAHHVNYLEDHPDVDFSYSDKYLFEGDGDIWQKSLWRLSPLPDIAPEDFLLRTMYSMNTMIPGMLVPSRCYAVAGPFDETLQRCEDHEMLLRLSSRFFPGNVGQATFVYRQHAGVRGAGAHSHDAEARFRVMLDYRQRIFRDVREQYSLKHYLDSRDIIDSDSLQGCEKALAILQRGCVMLHHGLVAEALADFDTALACNCEHTSPYAERLPAALSRAMDLEPWTVPHKSALLRSLSALLLRHGQPRLGRYVARGLYWSARRSFDNGAYGASLDATRMLALFCAYWAPGFILPSKAARRLR